MPYKDSEVSKQNRIEYYEKNKESILKYKKLYYKKNKVSIEEKKKMRELANKSKNQEKRKIYYLKNKEKIKKMSKIRYRKYYNDNKEEINLKHYLYKKFRRENDLEYRLQEVLRSRIVHALTSTKCVKSKRTEELIGKSISEVKKYLESMFQCGMTWNNYGFGDDKWHIDHIRPCSSFDLTDINQQKQCFHYTNLQPLWQIDNLQKGCKYNQ
jgi:hypothetical protein